MEDLAAILGGLTAPGLALFAAASASRRPSRAHIALGILTTFVILGFLWSMALGWAFAEKPSLVHRGLLFVLLVLGGAVAVAVFRGRSWSLLLLGFLVCVMAALTVWRGVDLTQTSPVAVVLGLVTWTGIMIALWRLLAPRFASASSEEFGGATRSHGG